MPRKGKQLQQPPRRPTPGQVPNLLVLDQFSEANLHVWEKRSREIDELYQTLYFDLQRERAARRAEMINALNAHPALPMDFEHWSRIVAYRWSLQPLSSAGSLHGFGGRFNLGADVDESQYAQPFPALYLADSYETAYREYYQCESKAADERSMKAAMSKPRPPSAGLKPEELALSQSTTHVRVSGHLERVLDVTDLKVLKPIAQVLAKFKTPPALIPLARRFNLGPASALLIRTPSKLQESIQERNWRSWPVQFGFPAPSQMFAELAQAAGYEGIRYRSCKKDGGVCLAVLSGNLGSNLSFVQLDDDTPAGILRTRLDMDSAEELAGWDSVRINQRPGLNWPRTGPLVM